MPLDLSKLTDEELDAYLSLKEGKKESYLTLPNLPGPKKADMKEVMTPNLVFDKAMSDTPIANPLMALMPNGEAKAQINKRYLGGSLGAATGTGPISAGLFGALGAAAPPQNAGDAAAAGAGLGIGGKLGKLVQNVPGIKGVLSTALAGLGEGAAVEGAHSAMTGESPQMGVGGAALSAGVPLLAKGLLQSPAKDSTYGKARTFLKELTGQPLEPSEVPGMRAVTSSENPKNNLLSPMGRVFAQTQNQAAKRVAAQKEIERSAKEQAQTLKNKITGLQGQRVKLQGLIDAGKRKNRRDVGKIDQEFKDMENEYLQPALDDAISMVFGDGTREKFMDTATQSFSKAMQDKSEILAARKQVAAAKSGQLKMPDGPLEATVNNAGLETLHQNMQKTNEALFKAKQDADTFKNIELPKIQETLRSNPAVDPKLQKFTKVATPTEFLDVLKDADHESVTALRNQLSPAGKKALQESFERTFSQMAVGPDGSLSNIGTASKAFPYDKVAAIYGGGVVGRAKADLAAKATADMMRMQKEDSNKFSYYGKKSVALASALGTPYFLIQATMSGSPEKALIKGAALGALTTAVAWPKIINKVVSDPKFGREFHEWSTSESAATALKNYPTVERFFRDNNEYAGKVKKAVEDTASDVTGQK